MKFFQVIFFILSFSIFKLYSQSYNYVLNNKEKSININSIRDTIFIDIVINNLNFNVDSVNNEKYLSISSNNFLPTQTIGKPTLLNNTNIFEIPRGKKPEFKILTKNIKTIDLNQFSYAKLIPVQESVSKTSQEVNFQKDNKIYLKNEFYYEDLVRMENIGFMRTHNLAKLIISPLKYNPVENLLQIYQELTLVVYFVDESEIETKSYTNDLWLESLHFDFVNYISLNSDNTNEDKAYLLNLPVNYLIITDSVFNTALTPFVNWKTQKGFNVETAFLNSANVGNTSTSIKQFIQQKFNFADSLNPPPTFVLLVGDNEIVPSGIGVTGNHVTDWYYSFITPDFLPDLLIGRFSATDTTELIAQINKTINYQKFNFSNSNYLNNALLVSGNDQAYSHLQGNSQINYIANNYLNQQNGNITNLILFPHSLNTNSLMMSLLDQGMGIVNYTGHGTVNGWSGPILNLSNVDLLNNINKPSVMIANACLTAKFDSQASIAESLVRLDNRGAVAYIGATNLTYWDEDFWWSVGFKPINQNPQFLPNSLGMWDRWFNFSNLSLQDLFPTISQMIIAGNLAVELSNSNLNNFYWEIYHALGDPSLMPFQRNVQKVTATHQHFLLIGANQLVVNTEAYAFVGFSLNNELIASAYANQNGIAILNFNPLVNPGIAKITVTKKNRQPYQENIFISLINGAQIVNLNFDFNDQLGNSNGIIDYSEILSFNFDVKNFGLDSVSNVYAKLTSLSPFLHVIIDSVFLGYFNSSQVKSFNNEFLVQVNNYVQNNSVANLKLQIFSGNNNWESIIQLNLNSPVYKLYDYTITDNVIGNNNLWFEAGETANASLKFQNLSNSKGHNVSVNLSSNNNHLNILQNQFYIDTISANETIEFNSLFSLSSQANFGDLISIFVNISDLHYSFNDTISFVVGSLVEDFETANFNKFPWFNGYNSAALTWQISNSEFYEGSFSAYSGNVNHDQFSELAIVVDVFQQDTISFYYKTSCENPGTTTYWDYLSFNVNDFNVGKFAGENDWSKFVYVLPAGIHTLSWKYTKDNSISAFEDKVWIDNIVFPKKSTILNTTSIVNSSNLENSFFVYPNPAENELFLSFDESINANVSIQITDVLGRNLFKEEIDTQNLINKTHKINIENFNKGIYFVILYSKNFISKQIIIKK